MTTTMRNKRARMLKSYAIQAAANAGLDGGIEQAIAARRMYRELKRSWSSLLKPQILAERRAGYAAARAAQRQAQA